MRISVMSVKTACRVASGPMMGAGGWWIVGEGLPKEEVSPSVQRRSALQMGRESKGRSFGSQTHSVAFGLVPGNGSM